MPYFSLLFFFISFLIILSAFLVITVKNPVHSVLFLVLVFLEATFILLLLEIEFLPLIFIIIYVGAIAILFLFVVMMIDVKIIKSPTNYLKYFSISVIIWLIFLFFILIGISLSGILDRFLSKSR